MMSHQRIKMRRQFLEQLEEEFNNWLQTEIEKLQAACSHPNIEFSEFSAWSLEDLGINCSDCGRVLLDPYEQKPV